MRCEDYPCCGHTDFDPCGPQWYDAPGAFDTSIPGNEHALCEHEVGFCDVVDYNELHEYDYDDTRDGVPWCYGCDGYARCDEFEPDGADTYQWETTEGVGYELDYRGEHDPSL